MQFRAYVPTVVQKFCSVEIERWALLLNEAEQKLAAIGTTLRGWSDFCECCQLENSREDLSLRQAIALRTRDRLAYQIDFIRRLVALDPYDERMKEAYHALSKEFTVDGQWLRFMHAAFSSIHDYAEYRERKRRAIELSDQVANEARALAGSIVQLEATGIVLPVELEFRRTWSAYGASDIELQCMVAQMVRVATSPNQENLVALLHKAAEAAQTGYAYFGVSEGAVDAAISKQKPNLKTEYLRAFGHVLTISPGSIGEPVNLTPGVRRAMAVTTTVALNGDVIVTEDDVRKAVVVSEFCAKTTRNLPGQRKISAP